MVEAVDAELGGVLIGERPADVVVAAHVVHPGACRRRCCAALAAAWAAGPTSRVASGFPGQRHLQRVVGELALLRGDVPGHFVGVDDRLGLEQQRRAPPCAQTALKACSSSVRLGQVLAAGAQLLPDEGHRIHPQDLHALVRQEQHLLGHGPEDRRVGVVQVPLEAVERGPDPPAVGRLQVKLPGVVSGKISRTVCS